MGAAYAYIHVNLRIPTDISRVPRGQIFHTGNIALALLIRDMSRNIFVSHKSFLLAERILFEEDFNDESSLPSHIIFLLSSHIVGTRIYFEIF